MPFDALGYLPTPTPAVTEPREAWRDVLMRAADEIELVGWWTGNPTVWQNIVYLISPKRRQCAMTAIIAVARSLRISNEAAIEARIRFMRHIGGGPIHMWNDIPGRTAAEVCAALRSCAQEPADA